LRSRNPVHVTGRRIRSEVVIPSGSEAEETPGSDAMRLRPLPFKAAHFKAAKEAKKNISSGIAQRVWDSR
jgi:hypothetical protein